MLKEQLISFLGNHPQYMYPETEECMRRGMEKVRRFLPRQPVTDFLFKKPRPSKLIRNLVYQLFRTDDYIQKHKDLCQKILIYSMDWLSGVRERYSCYTLPRWAKIKKYCIMVYEVLKADLSPCEYRQGEYNGLMLDNESGKYTEVLVKQAIKEQHPVSRLASFGVVAFPIVQKEIGEMALTYLVACSVYFIMCKYYDDPRMIELLLVRGGVEQNPGPYCEICGEINPRTRCVVCDPVPYIVSENTVSTVEMSRSPVCIFCRGKFPLPFDPNTLPMRIMIGKEGLQPTYIYWVINAICKGCAENFIHQYPIDMDNPFAHKYVTKEASDRRMARSPWTVKYHPEYPWLANEKLIKMMEILFPWCRGLMDFQSYGLLNFAAFMILIQGQDIYIKFMKGKEKDPTLFGSYGPELVVNTIWDIRQCMQNSVYQEDLPKLDRMIHECLG